MKKKYQQPLLEDLGMTTSFTIAVSESKVITEDVLDTQIDGDKAWSRGEWNQCVDWEDEQEDSI